LAERRGPAAWLDQGKPRARFTPASQQQHKKPLVDIAKTHFAALQKIYLAMRKAGTYMKCVRRFPLHFLGRFLPKLGGAFGHRPFFARLTTPRRENPNPPASGSQSGWSCRA
jgi:hypothetical protein